MTTTSTRLRESTEAKPQGGEQPTGDRHSQTTPSRPHPSCGRVSAKRAGGGSAPSSYGHRHYADTIVPAHATLPRAYHRWTRSHFETSGASVMSRLCVSLRSPSLLARTARARRLSWRWCAPSGNWPFTTRFQTSRIPRTTLAALTRLPTTGVREAVEQRRYSRRSKSGDAPPRGREQSRDHPEQWNTVPRSESAELPRSPSICASPEDKRGCSTSFEIGACGYDSGQSEGHGRLPAMTTRGAST